MKRALPAAVLAGLTGLAIAVPADAGVRATISIGACTVDHSRNAGGFTYAYCPVTSDSPTGDVGLSAAYTVNLDTYVPLRDAGYSPERGTIAFAGGGQELQNIKFAFRRLTFAQVQKRLKVTLSDPQGAILGTAVARAKS